ERCLAILTGCQSRDAVIEGFDQLSTLLSQANDPMANATQVAARECRELPDEYVFQVRDDFIRQCNAYLSAAATIGDSQETEVAGTPQGTPMAADTPQQLSEPVGQKLLKDIETSERHLAILTKCQTRDEIIDGLTQIAALLGQEDDPAARAFASAVLKSAKMVRELPDEMISETRDQLIEMFSEKP
ncbi:MAG: hypothetical protein V3S10_06410, partial [Dehalococcoidales bacterium]